MYAPSAGVDPATGNLQRQGPRAPAHHPQQPCASGLPLSIESRRAPQRRVPAGTTARLGITMMPSRMEWNSPSAS